jgi:hypothetical protein
MNVDTFCGVILKGIFVYLFKKGFLIIFGWLLIDDRS